MQSTKVWLSSDALTRLEVKPNATRLEGRVTSMLLAALPSSIKSDIIAEADRGLVTSWGKGPSHNTTTRPRALVKMVRHVRDRTNMVAPTIPCATYRDHRPLAGCGELCGEDPLQDEVPEAPSNP